MYIFILSFTTSHVTVYHAFQDFEIASIKFQYISCYCLSMSGLLAIVNSSEFQYISCYCLSVKAHSCILFFSISIHLMLLFIRNNRIYRVRYRHFNTSHVTVYPTFPVNSSLIASFQYISCYCLSILYWVVIIHMQIFQYISCYCLSGGRSVFIPNGGISIHLMLLFINLKHGEINAPCLFQYISCYCLSTFCRLEQHKDGISIHLMLLFIPFLILIRNALTNFNTSHVTVYLEL